MSRETLRSLLADPAWPKRLTELAGRVDAAGKLDEAVDNARTRTVGELVSSSNSSATVPIARVPGSSGGDNVNATFYGYLEEEFHRALGNVDFSAYGSD